MSTETVVSSPNRRQFLQTAGVTGLAVGAGALLAGCGGGSSNNSSPSVQISEAAIATGFKSIQADEDNHVQVLIAGLTALGATPRPKPSFFSPLLTTAQTSVSTFVQLAAALGNTEPGAYLSAVPLAALDSNTAQLMLGSLSYTPLEAASAIAIVEGRHAGFFNALLGRTLLTDPTNGDSVEPANQSREVILSPSMVATRALPFTGVIAGADTADPSITTGTNLNGGPALLTDTTITSASLADIFNYALFLEYLGSTFYDLNVPVFFG